MNFLYGIGSYMLAASLLMIMIVGIKNIIHNHSGYDQTHANENLNKDKNLHQQNIAA